MRTSKLAWLPVSALLWLLMLGWGVAGVAHALSHELAARALGIPRERSFGTGPALWTRDGWRVSALPGAYVAARLDDVGAVRAALYLAAGPIGSVGFAWAVLTAGLAASMMLGEPEAPSVVGNVAPGSPAEVAGVAVDDRIVAVNGRAVGWWSDLPPLPTGDVPVTVERDGARHDLRLTVPPGTDPGFGGWRRGSLVGVAEPGSEAAAAGLRTGDAVLAVDGADVTSWDALVGRLDAPGPHVVTVSDGASARDVTLAASPTLPRWGLEPVERFAGEVAPGLPAHTAGLRRGDRIDAVDGAPVRGWGELVAGVQRSEGRALTLEVTREGARHSLEVVPERSRGGRYVVGISQWEGAFVPVAAELRRHGPVAAVASAAPQAFAILGRSVDALRGIVSLHPEELGGPVAIARVASTAPRPWPNAVLIALASTIAARSLLLGVYNLLPLAWSDALTAVDLLAHRTTGCRVPHRVVAVATALLLLGACGLVVASDLSRWLSG